MKIQVHIIIHHQYLYNTKKAKMKQVKFFVSMLLFIPSIFILVGKLIHTPNPNSPNLVDSANFVPIWIPLVLIVIAYLLNKKDN